MNLVESPNYTRHILYNSYCPDGIVAAISLRSFHKRNVSSDREEKKSRFLADIGHPGCPIASAQQVHGNEIAPVEEAGLIPGFDGLATDVPGLFLTVTIADCLPIFLWGKGADCIALLHAGWRGTAARIAVYGVRLLSERYGTKIEDIRALLGPCICPSCYEVGPEVAGHFDKSFLKRGRADRFHLDIRKANRRQLLECGLPEGAIVSDDLCTNCRRDLFFSHRGEGEETGRMIAALGLLPDEKTITPEM